MINRHITSLLWADDDSTLLLRPLRWALERENFLVRDAKTYAVAEEVLGESTFESLLVDTILPHAGGGTLNSYMGLELAEQAARGGVRCVSFLSVVSLAEVGESYNRLVVEYPQVKFHYADKLMLMEPHAIEQLIESLRP